MCKSHDRESGGIHVVYTVFMPLFMFFAAAPAAFTSIHPNSVTLFGCFLQDTFNATKF